jgi:large subunit ribosomal protein L30
MTAESTKKTTAKAATKDDATKVAKKKTSSSATKEAAKGGAKKAAKKTTASSATKEAAKGGAKTAAKKTAASSRKKTASSAKKKAKKQLRITQVKSQIGFAQNQRRVLAGLGLGRIGKSVVRPDDGCIRGMVAKVNHLISVEEVEG